MDKEVNNRLNKLEKDSHPPVDWDKKIDKMETSWKELYHKLVMDYADLKKELEMGKVILHNWLPIVEKDDEGRCL